MMKGIVYNVPGKASVELFTSKKTLYKGEVQVTEFGTQEALAPVMFEDKKLQSRCCFIQKQERLNRLFNNLLI